MARYHVNPETGNTGLCRARANNCPFGLAREHLGSSEEAREHYEAVMSGRAPRPFSWLLSKRGEVVRGPEDNLLFAQELNAEYERLKTRLTEDQVAELHNYTMYGFERTNALLRNTPFPHNRFEDPERALSRTKVQVRVLDEVFAHEEGKARTLYRYIRAQEGESVASTVAGMEAKGSLCDPAFLSASASIDYPLYELLEKRDKEIFLMELATDRGVAVQPKKYHQPGHHQSMENEVLLPRNVEFELVGVEVRKKLAFGGMKEALLKHANIGSLRDRRAMESKPHHFATVVKLVQKC